MKRDKQLVKDFWDRAACGELLYLRGESEREKYLNQARDRYRLEPYIHGFAGFERARGQKVLEIGVGLGADHQEFAQHHAELFGCDLTPRAAQHVRKRFGLFGLESRLSVADGENLPYRQGQFDYVYSWGVIHHSPDTRRAVDEIHRVLCTGGKARIMIYHRNSLVGYMLWLRYALLRLRPLTSLREIYSQHLESPGTKAYSLDEGHELFKAFSSVQIDTLLTHSDLLQSQAGQRHTGPLLSLARRIYPRALIKRLLPNHGLFMLISAVK